MFNFAMIGLGSFLFIPDNKFLTSWPPPPPQRPTATTNPPQSARFVDNRYGVALYGPAYNGTWVALHQIDIVLMYPLPYPPPSPPPPSPLAGQSLYDAIVAKAASGQPINLYQQIISVLTTTASGGTTIADDIHKRFNELYTVLAPTDSALNAFLARMSITSADCITGMSASRREVCRRVIFSTIIPNIGLIPSYNSSSYVVRNGNLGGTIKYAGPLGPFYGQTPGTTTLYYSFPDTDNLSPTKIDDLFFKSDFCPNEPTVQVVLGGLPAGSVSAGLGV